MKTLLEYQQDITHAERVRRLVVMPEYNVLKIILKRMLDNDIERIIAKEDADARSRIKCLRDLEDEIQADIDRGIVASEALKEGQYLDSPKGDNGQ